MGAVNSFIAIINSFFKQNSGPVVTPGDAVIVNGQEANFTKLNGQTIPVIQKHFGGMPVDAKGLDPQIKVVTPYYTMIPCGVCHICGVTFTDEDENKKTCKSRVICGRKPNPQQACYDRWSVDPSAVVLHCKNNSCKKSAEASLQIHYAGMGIGMYTRNSEITKRNFHVKRTNGTIDNNWKINNLRFKKNMNSWPEAYGKFYFYMSNDDADVEKGVLLEDFIAANPEVDITQLKPDRTEYINQIFVEMVEKALLSIKETGKQDRLLNDE
jgi:hypothetical protein